MANKPGKEYEPCSGESEPVRETDPLLIPELLIRILEYASPEEKATAARVCRRWSDPALEMLWRDLTDLGPFLKIFALLKNITNSRISPAETLERIKSYGARVRTVRFDASHSSVHESGTAEVYRALCNSALQQSLPTVSLPSSGLFPYLRTLEWRAEHLRRGAEDTLGAVSYFLCPSLKHLYVSGIVGQPRYHEHTFTRDLGVNYVPFFLTLNAMDGLKLESLELRMHDFAQPLTQDNVEVGLFLRRHQHTLLHFFTWTTEFVRHFQNQLCEFSRLRSLEVNVDEELQASAFIERLADGVPEMQSLYLKVHPFEQSHPWQGLWNALKRLRKLTKLRLEVPEIEELDEGDVRSMQEAWPALSYLYILQKYGGWRDQYEGFSREFLSAITRHFSHSLTTLGLALKPNIRSALPMRPVRFEKLQLLYIQSSFEPEDPEDLVRYFAQILPREAVLTGDWVYEWNDVVHDLEQARANHPETLQEQ